MHIAQRMSGTGQRGQTLALHFRDLKLITFKLVKRPGGPQWLITRGSNQALYTVCLDG